MTAEASPLTQVYDTVVNFEGTRATVVEVLREDCAACDLCLEAAECLACEACSPCVEQCEPCLQTVTFLVPDLAPGPTTLVITNRFGSSPALPFTVAEEQSADTGDTGI